MAQPDVPKLALNQLGLLEQQNKWGSPDDGMFRSAGSFAARSEASFATSRSRSESITVALHVRPLLSHERAAGCIEGLLNIHPPGASGQQVTVDMQLHQNTFAFDRVYSATSEHATPPSQLYDDYVKPCVDALVDGINSCVLAYGQTGAGKSFTMGTDFSQAEAASSGTWSLDRDWLPLSQQAVEAVMQRVKAAKQAGTDIQVSCSFMEIYQDRIRDLLAATPASSGEQHTSSVGARRLPRHNDTPRQVQLRDPDPKKEVILVGLEEVEVTRAQELHQCLLDGVRVRATAATNANLHSSRSHAIFVIKVRQVRKVSVPLGTSSPSQGGSRTETPRSTFSFRARRSSLHIPESGSGSLLADDRQTNLEEVVESKMYLVDLAGSERVARSGAVGERLAEACTINQALLALGNVIDALCEKSRTHIPYRSHVLTRILRHALGGNSRTLMVACVSPTDLDISESLNTMRYASRARNIKNAPVRNTKHSGPSSEEAAVMVLNLKAENEVLREEAESLRTELFELQASLAAGSSVAKLHQAVAEAEAAQAEVADLKEERHLLREELELERMQATAAKEKVASLTLKLRDALGEVEALQSQLLELKELARQQLQVAAEELGQGMSVEDPDQALDMLLAAELARTGSPAPIIPHPISPAQHAAGVHPYALKAHSGRLMQHLTAVEESAHSEGELDFDDSLSGGQKQSNKEHVAATSPESSSYLISAADMNATTNLVSALGHAGALQTPASADDMGNCLEAVGGSASSIPESNLGAAALASPHIHANSSRLGPYHHQANTGYGMAGSRTANSRHQVYLGHPGQGAGPGGSFSQCGLRGTSTGSMGSVPLSPLMSAAAKAMDPLAGCGVMRGTSPNMDLTGMSAGALSGRLGAVLSPGLWSTGGVRRSNTSMSRTFSRTISSHMHNLLSGKRGGFVSAAQVRLDSPQPWGLAQDALIQALECPGPLRELVGNLKRKHDNAVLARKKRAAEEARAKLARIPGSVLAPTLVEEPSASPSAAAGTGSLGPIDMEASLERWIRLQTQGCELEVMLDAEREQRSHLAEQLAKLGSGTGDDVWAGAGTCAASGAGVEGEEGDKLTNQKACLQSRIEAQNAKICGLLAMRHTCQESVDTLQARCTSAAKAAVAASQNHGGSGAGNSDSSSAAGAIALVMEAAGLKGPGMTVSEAVLAVIWLLLMAINMRQVKSELQARVEVLGEEVAFKGELAALYDREVAATAARLEELEAQADVLQAQNTKLEVLAAQRQEAVGLLVSARMAQADAQEEARVCAEEVEYLRTQMNNMRDKQASLAHLLGLSSEAGVQPRQSTNFRSQPPSSRTTKEAEYILDSSPTDSGSETRQKQGSWGARVRRLSQSFKFGGT